jgi:hypothetical protein
MEAFYFLGGILAACALIVSFLGIVREDFPGSDGAERAVAVVFVVLVLATVGAAVIGALNEDHGGGHEGGHEEAALVLGR